MGLMFGTDDNIECLDAHKFSGPHGDSVCLASRISLHFVGAGVYVTNNGYVLKIDGSKSYYPLTAKNLDELQQSGVVSSPLPPIHVSWWQYVFGYSLWIVIGGLVLAAVMKRLLGKLRPFMLSTEAPVKGPPVTRTDADRWLSAEFARQLEPGEHLQHQACGYDADPMANKGCNISFVALTDSRVLFIRTAKGFTGPKVENHGVRALRRADIARAGNKELFVVFEFSDGSYEPLWVDGSQRQFSNQWLFARDVPRLLTAALAKAA